MPKGTFDSKLAKVVFGDDVTRQRGPLSSEQQKECAEKLLRWAAARLGSVDLPFFLPELDREESEHWIELFVTTARTTAASMAS